MLKIKSALLFFSLLFTAPHAFAEWEALLPWVDKYPAEPLGAGRSSLLRQIQVQSALKKILPSTDFVALGRYDAEAPVRRVGDYLVINKCQPHNCPSSMAMVVIDVKNEKLWAGFFSRRERSVTTRWFGTHENYSVLPAEIQKEFLSRHGD